MSEAEPEPRWWLYLLRSASDRRSYVGITTQLERRLAQHNGEQPGGAKSTRAGRPWVLARSWGPFSRSEASIHEHQLKRRRGPARARWEPPVAKQGGEGGKQGSKQGSEEQDDEGS